MAETPDVDSSSAEAAGPFGVPNASRQDIAETLSDLMVLPRRVDFGGAAAPIGDAMTCVIAGRPGSGKTVHLRSLFSAQENRRSVYVDAPSTAAPDADLILRTCHWFPEYFLVDAWSLLWRRAIMRSLATHLLAARELSGILDAEGADYVRVKYGHLIGVFRRPRSVYSQLRDIIYSHTSGIHLRRYIKDPRWEQLEDLLSEILSGMKPVVFHLDNIDGRHDRVPLYWLRCQEGLLLQVLQLQRELNFARFRVVVCVNELALAFAAASERIRGDDHRHIRILEWPREAVGLLLQHKIRRLSGDFQMIPSSHGDSESWLGVTTIRDELRGVEQDVSEHLIRHTRLVPRDIVSLGNDLCRAVAEQKALGHRRLPKHVLRHVMFSAARRWGNSQLAQCGRHIIAHRDRRQPLGYGDADNEGLGEKYAESIRLQLKKALEPIGTDRFGAERLRRFQEGADSAFGAAVDVPSILWRSGLLGFADGARDQFYSSSSGLGLDLSRDLDEYVLHPCLMHSIPGLHENPKRAVQPYYGA